MTFAASVQGEVIQDALAALGTLVNEAKLHVEPGGLRATAVDPANVGMINLELDASAFARYAGDGVVVGVDLERLRDMVSFADSDEFVHLELDDQKLNIEVSNLEMTQALIDPDTIRKEPDLPDLDWPATVVLSADDLGRCWSAADLVADHVELAADPDGFHASATGDTDDVTVDVPKSDLLGYPATPDESVVSMFSLDYLTDVHAAVPKDAAISVVLGDELPTRLRWSDHDGGLSVTFMLAPRIGNGGA